MLNGIPKQFWLVLNFILLFFVFAAIAWAVKTWLDDERREGKP